LTPAEKGIGAGAIAGIVIGAAAIAAFAVFGGKKGYDLYTKRLGSESVVHDNPIYEDNKVGENPLYELPEVE
jgi:hypothetical protein